MQPKRSIMGAAQTKSHWVLPRIPPLHKIAFDAAAWWQNLTELENLCSLADVSETFSVMSLARWFAGN